MVFQESIRAMDACREAVRWVNGRDLRTAFTECQRGDWMLWLAGRRQAAERSKGLG